MSGFEIIDVELNLEKYLDSWDIINVQFGAETDWDLIIHLSFSNNRSGKIRFSSIMSFCVQDESYLLDYWKQRRIEIKSRGIVYRLSKSSYRDEINSGYIKADYHYLISGQNTCVEVITSGKPNYLETPSGII